MSETIESESSDKTPFGRSTPRKKNAHALLRHKDKETENTKKTLNYLDEIDEVVFNGLNIPYEPVNFKINGKIL